MDKYVNSETSQHIMKLIQLGANVQVVSGKMVYVKFVLAQDVEVAYVYHINKKNKYYLERIKPYPLPLKEFNSSSEVIETIKIDYDQYSNAVKSHNINKFVEVNKNLHHTIKSFEDLFLYYNIPHELIKKIDTSITEIQTLIDNSSTECNRVFFDKEPETLKTTKKD